MRKYALITVVIFLVLAACEYDAPLVGEALLPIDQALLGTWEYIPQDEDGQESVHRIVIRKDSANLYEMELSDGAYAKAWLAELEGIRFIQWQYTGDNDGPVGAEVTNLFGVASYALDNGELVIRSLSTCLVNTDLTDTAALQVAFIANRDDPNLFLDPAQYRKLTKG